MRTEVTRCNLAAAPARMGLLLGLELISTFLTSVIELVETVKKAVRTKWDEARGIAWRKTLRLRACDTGVAP